MKHFFRIMIIQSENGYKQLERAQILMHGYKCMNTKECGRHLLLAVVFIKDVIMTVLKMRIISGGILF